MKINYSTVANEKLASYRYRIKIPSEYLIQQGYEVSIGKPERADIGVFSKHFNARDYEVARQSTRYSRVIFDVCDYHLDGPYSDHYQRMIYLADKVTAATQEMANCIEEETGVKAEVIPDPYEFEEKEPEFIDGTALLWFGHASNIAPLKFEIEDGNLGNHWLKVISNPNELMPVVPWSMEATIKGLNECDVVIIPQEDTKQNRCKGANRMVESIRSGRFVVANKMPAYEQFSEWMWLGDIQEGLAWTKQNSSEVTDRIKAAQKYVRETFSPDKVGSLWESALTSGVATSV